MSRIPFTQVRYRHLNRLRQILGILAKYGFEEFISHTNLRSYLRRPRLNPKKPDKDIRSLSRYQRIRMALEELGPTFIKLGQVLSSRYDLLPEALILELERLQDEVPPDPDLNINNVIETELPAEKNEKIRQINATPMASASIAQVHYAYLAGHGPVVLKLLRPGIRQTVKVDLEIIRYIIRAILKRFPEYEAFKPFELLSYYERTIFQEMDFNNEAFNILRFAGNFKGDQDVCFPKVYREFSTDRLLCLEFMNGVKISSPENLLAAGFDQEKFANLGVDLYFRQIFEHGFFHADPHPGNLLITNDQKLCFLDFGMMGSILPEDQEWLSEIIFHFLRNDTARIVKSFEKISGSIDSSKKKKFSYEVHDLSQKIRTVSLGELDVSEVFTQFYRFIYNYNIFLPPDFFLLMRAITLLEGVGKRLHPDFQMFQALKNYSSRLIRNRFSPNKLSNKMLDAFYETGDLIQELPENLKDITRLMRDGRFNIEFKHKGLENMERSLNKITNRIAMAIITASILIGSALIVLSRTPPLVYNIPVIGLAGFLVSVVLGIWIIISIIRKNRL